MAGDVDWNVCVICQKEGGNLKCPRSLFLTAAKKLEIFETFHVNIHKLWNAGVIVDTKLPKHITAKTLFDNNAKWHKECHLSFATGTVEKRLKAHKKNQPPAEEPPAVTQPAKRQRENFNSKLCIFCQTSTDEVVHEVTKLSWGQDRRQMAIQMEDDVMSIRLVGDMIAVEAKYHKSCEQKFRNKHREFKVSEVNQEDKEQQLKQERAFLELIDYMKNEAKNGVALFPMAELNKQYNERKVELGLPPETNHLKNE